MYTLLANRQEADFVWVVFFRTAAAVPRGATAVPDAGPAAGFVEFDVELPTCDGVAGRSTAKLTSSAALEANWLPSDTPLAKVVLLPGWTLPQ